MSRLDTRARKLMDLREKNALAQAASKKAKEDLDEYEAEFWSELEDEGLKTITLDLGEPYGRVQLGRRETKYSQVLDRGELLAWLEEHGLAEELMKPTEKKKELNAYVKTLHEQGNPLPPGLGYTVDRYVSVTRKK